MSWELFTLGLLLGVLCTWFAFNRQLSQQKQALATLKTEEAKLHWLREADATQLEQLKQDKESLQTSLTTQHADLNQAQQTVATLTERLASFETLSHEKQALSSQLAEASESIKQNAAEIASLQQQLAQHTALLEEKQRIEAKLAEANLQHTADVAEITELNQRLDHSQTALAEAKQALHDAETHWKAQWEKDFQKFLNTTLEDTRKKLTEEAKTHHGEGSKALKEDMDKLVKPLTTLLTDYQSKIESLNKDHLSRFTTLDDHVTQLANAKNELVNVLKTNRGAGHWGELQLLRLLESAGLMQGTHYEYQQGTAQGRPDVKLLLPDNRYVFIDAKTLQFKAEATSAHSSANTDAPSAQTIEVQGDVMAATPAPSPQQVRKQHLTSLQQAVKELAKRNYTHDQDGTPDFVVLFVPQESMLSLALEEDPNYWEAAYRDNVVLASPFTLLTLLRMIKLGWHQANLEANVREVFKVGTELQKRLVLYTERMDKVDTHLKTLNKSVEDALTSFKGKQGIVSQVNKLEDVGCKSAKTLALPIKELATLAGD